MTREPFTIYAKIKGQRGNAIEKEKEEKEPIDYISLCKGLFYGSLVSGLIWLTIYLILCEIAEIGR
jgi:hypothetical protein